MTDKPLDTIEAVKGVRHEVSAGGVVYKRVGETTLIGFILDPYHKWIFPKGHVEPGESMKQAALRETREEMGLKSLQVKAELGEVCFSFKRDKLKIHKVVHYFLMEADSGERGKPQKDELIRAVRWVSIRGANKILGYKNTGAVLRRAIKILDNPKKSHKRKNRPDHGHDAADSHERRDRQTKKQPRH